MTSRAHSGDRPAAVHRGEGNGSLARTPSPSPATNLVLANKPDDFILAIVEFTDEGAERIHYVRQPFHREPDFAETSRNYQMAELIARAELPS